MSRLERALLMVVWSLALPIAGVLVYGVRTAASQKPRMIDRPDTYIDHKGLSPQGAPFAIHYYQKPRPFLYHGRTCYYIGEMWRGIPGEQEATGTPGLPVEFERTGAYPCEH